MNPFSVSAASKRLEIDAEWGDPESNHGVAKTQNH